MGGVGYGAAEEDWSWDLNPGAAAIPEGENHMVLKEKKEDHTVLGEKREDHAALVKSREDHVVLK